MLLAFQKVKENIVWGKYIDAFALYRQLTLFYLTTLYSEKTR